MSAKDIQNGVYQIWTDGSDVEAVKIVDGRVIKRFQGGELDQLNNMKSSAADWFREGLDVVEVDSKTLSDFAELEDIHESYIRVFKVPGEW
jgi:hypothetical protein